MRTTFLTSLRHFKNFCTCPNSLPRPQLRPRYVHCATAPQTAEPSAHKKAKARAPEYGVNQIQVIGLQLLSVGVLSSCTSQWTVCPSLAPLTCRCV